MKTLAILLAACALALAGCKSAPVVPPVRAQAVVDGKGVAGPVTVGGIPVTPAYQIDGHAQVTAQYPEQPYLTITGDYTTTVTSVPGAGLSPEATPERNVLIRVPYPAGQVKDPLPGSKGPIGEVGACSGSACPPPSSAPPPAPSATPPASANGRTSASKFCGAAAPMPAAAPCVSAAATSVSTDCRPVYVSPCTGRAKLETPSAEGWNRASMTGYHPGQRPWDPLKACPQNAGLGEPACPRGIPAILQGIADLFSGRFV